MSHRIDRSFALAAIALSATLLTSTAALAQVDVPIPEADEGETNTRVWAGYDHMFNTDINNGGQIQRDSFLAGISHQLAFGEDETTKLRTNLTYQMDSYDWSKGAKNGGKAGGIARGFRWTEIHTPQLVMLLDVGINENWSILTAGLIRMSAETGANLDDAVTFGGGLGFNWVSDDKKLGLGLLAAAITEIEDDVNFAILPLVHWQFADAWKFKLSTLYLGAIGYGPEVIWTPSESLEVALGAAYQRRRFRLDTHKTVKNGVGQETTAPVYARVGFKPGENMTFDLYAGVNVAGRIRTARKGGGKLRNSDYDPTPMIGAKFEYRF